jgi:hypothetical protein
MKYHLCAAILGIVALFAFEAYAGNCTTTCSRTYTGGSKCNTWCN